MTRYLVSISAGDFSLKQMLVDAVILPQLGLIGFIGCPVHLVSLRDKHRRPILDTTPLSVRLRALKRVNTTLFS